MCCLRSNPCYVPTAGEEATRRAVYTEATRRVVYTEATLPYGTGCVARSSLSLLCVAPVLPTVA